MKKQTSHITGVTLTLVLVLAGLGISGCVTSPPPAPAVGRSTLIDESRTTVTPPAVTNPQATAPLPRQPKAKFTASNTHDHGTETSLTEAFSQALAAGKETKKRGMCKVAADIAQRGISTFKTTPTKGIKLLLKAATLCPDPEHQYNLGMACLAYGHLREAEQFLSLAVNQKTDKVAWTNNLAWTFLKNGKNGQSITMAQKALALNPNFQPAHDTLARAYLAQGNFQAGLKQISQAPAGSAHAAKITKAREEITTAYITYFLKMIKDGSVSQGVEGLKQGAYVPEIAVTHCRVLVQLNRLDAAMDTVADYRRTFSGVSRFNELYEEIFARKIQQFYQEFKNGEPALALQAAKEFSEQYPNAPEAKKTYDDLFNAYIADAVAAVKIPGKRTQTTTVPAQTAGGRVDSLLAAIGNGTDRPNTGNALIVDVDESIPQGKTRNPNAIAVVVGNQRYKAQNRGLSDVTYAERDALVMKKYLETTLGFSPENIILKTNVTSGDLRNLFGTRQIPKGMLQNRIRPGKSDVFIYYSGHGGPGPQGQTAYLVPVDAQVDYIANNGYPLDLLYDILENLGAKKLTVMLDTCFSGNSAAGSLFKNISPAMVKTASPARQMTGATLFCAADKDQVATWYPAKRHSLFTYYFMKGLQGKADLDRDRRITVDEMRTFLAEEVRIKAGELTNRIQTPLIMGDGQTVLVTLK